MKIPVPGNPVRGSKTGSPIMTMFDLLGRRWAMGILWTLNERGPLNFRALQAACDNISPGMLNTRLKELRAAKLIEMRAEGYCATDLGAEVYEALLPLSEVSKVWADAMTGS